MNNLSFEKDDSNQKKSGAEACRSDSDDYTDSEKACINSALNILVYANNTEKKLREKLYRKGYESAAIDTAIDYVKGKGYIDENAQILDAAELLATAKLYGKKIISVELYKKGLKRDAIASIDYTELGIDFIAGCAALICRTYRLRNDEDKRSFVPDDRQIGSLIRFGYSVGEFKEAVRLLLDS